MVHLFLQPGCAGEKSARESREEGGEEREQAFHEGHDLLHQVSGEGLQPEQGNLREKIDNDITFTHSFFYSKLALQFKSCICMSSS